jgi:hypothetical protein
MVADRLGLCARVRADIRVDDSARQTRSAGGYLGRCEFGYTDGHRRSRWCGGVWRAPASKTGKSASEYETTKIPTVTDAPYGRGSVRAGAGRSGPSGWLIKGNEDAKAYHTPDSPSYGQTVADVWFRSEDRLERLGSRHGTSASST